MDGPHPAKGRIPEACQAGESELASASLPSMRQRGSAVAIGAVGALSVASIFAGARMQNAAAAENAAAIRELGRYQFVDRSAHPTALDIVRSPEFLSAFVSETKALIEQIPALERYKEAIEPGRLNVTIGCTKEALSQMQGEPAGDYEPAGALCFDRGRIVLDEQVIAEGLARRIAQSIGAPDAGAVIGEVKNTAFAMLPTMLHELGHELHDRALESRLGLPHFMVTLEEELTVELEAMLDFEAARLYVLDNASSFGADTVRAAYHMGMTPQSWDRMQFEEQFAIGYARTISVHEERERILEAWSVPPGFDVPDPRLQQELANTGRILSDPERFELLREEICAALARARERWDAESPAYAAKSSAGSPPSFGQTR